LRMQTDDARHDLVPLILAARKSGMTLRAIADATGLTFARIHQIEKSSAQSQIDHVLP
jgi:transcriptional regulator with XRE-family HTH domain